MARVLIIDDDSGVRTLLRDLLEDAGYEVIDADNGDSGFNLYAANPADLVLTDIYMPKSEGIETIRNLCRAFPGDKIVAMSGIDLNGPPDFLSIAKKLGAEGSLTKPFDRASLLATVRDILKKP